MDETSLLRRSRSDIPERSTQDIERGRAALLAHIDRDSPEALFAALGDGTVFTPAPTRAPRQPRRRTATWAGLSALGATGVVGALVAANVLGVPGWHGGADAAAALALESAAIAALEFSDPVVGPGQYIRVRTDAVVAGAGDMGSGETAFLEKNHSELYIPADRDDDWVWIRCVGEPFQTFGPRSEAFAAMVMDEYERGDADIIRWMPGGSTTHGSTFGGYQNGNKSDGDFDALPLDPQQLLDWIYRETEHQGQSRDGAALVWIADTLRSGTVPADVRASLYKAAAKIPGVAVTEDQATLNGTTGIAIGRIEPASNVRQDLIIDPATGQFIGERQVTLSGYADLPAGTAESWTAVATTVVDGAPATASTCGDPG